MLDRLPVRWTSRADACEALVRLLFDRTVPHDAPTRRRAGRLLCDLAGPADAPRLVRLAVEEDDRYVRSRALEALRELEATLCASDLARLLARALGEASPYDLARRLAQVTALARTEEDAAAVLASCATLDGASCGELLTRLLDGRRRPTCGVEALASSLRERSLGAGSRGGLVVRVLRSLGRAGLALTVREVDAWRDALARANERSRQDLLALVPGAPTLVEAVLAEPALWRLASEQLFLPLPHLVDLHGESGLWARFVQAVEAADRGAPGAGWTGDPLRQAARLVRLWPQVAPRMLSFVVEGGWQPRTRSALVWHLFDVLPDATTAAALQAYRAGTLPEVFGAVVEGTERTGRPWDDGLLRAALETTDWRLPALRGLHRRTGPLEAELLARCRALVDDPDPRVRVEAHVALASRGAGASIETLAAAAVEAGAGLAGRVAAIDALARLAPARPGVRAAMIALLRAREGADRPTDCPCCPDLLARAAARALGAEGSPEALDALLGSYWRVTRESTAAAIGDALVGAARSTVTA
jgi:HEAT repeat protein